MHTRLQSQDHASSSSNRNEFQSRPFTEEADPALQSPGELAAPSLQAKSSPAGLNHNFGHIPIFATKRAAIQPKLTVGEPNDQYEQEADRVAGQVVSMSATASQQPVRRQSDEEEELQMSPLAASITPLIQREAEPEEEELQTKPVLQLQRAGDNGAASGIALERQLNQSKGGGSSLSNEVRAFMEPRFGVDFSHVRVHTGSDAVQMNRELSAQAFTHKQDIYFGDGRYDPTSAQGKHLLAHELTHVVQQTGAVQRQENSTAIQRQEHEDDAITAESQAHASPEANQAGAPHGNAPPAALESGGEEIIQAARDTAWAGNYVSVDAPPRSLIGNVSAGSGSYRFGYGYEVRYLYLGDTRGGIDGPRGNLRTVAHRISSQGGLVYGPNLQSTTPGQYKVWVSNPGGTFSKSMRAEESFTVVDPVRIATEPRRRQTLFDFQNPIPLQMVGDSQVEFQLSQQYVHNRRVAVNASGSSSSSVTEKLSFGVQLGLDNDAGSTGQGNWGFSSATQGTASQQWNQERYHQQETTLGRWMKYTFHPRASEAGRSKMLIPKYEWVEWDAQVYPHNPETLLTTGEQQTVVIGMLRPTGEVQEMRSTDEGVHSNSAPSENAQTDVNPNDPEASQQHDNQLPSVPGWRTLPGARWDDGSGSRTLQFIQGPLSMQPAGRDYGMQKGAQIHPGNEDETVEFGSSYNVSLQDGLTASRSQEQSGVATNNESRSLEANPGIKGIGSIGDSISFENETSLSNSTGTGLSTSSGVTETTTTSVSHKVTKKRRQNQFILFTPLVNHKVYKVGYGARQPEGRRVTEADLNIFYVHTYQHSPLPHIKVFDVSRNPDVPTGFSDPTRYTEV